MVDVQLDVVSKHKLVQWCLEVGFVKPNGRPRSYADIYEFIIKDFIEAIENDKIIIEGD